MGLLEPITHKEEIESLLNEAQSMYDNAKNKFESQKKQTTKRLENLGKVKVNAWTEGMDSFVTAFGTFKNVEKWIEELILIWILLVLTKSLSRCL